jgi:hypothetical protein
MDLVLAGDQLDREEVALPQVRTVRGDRVYLVGAVCGAHISPWAQVTPTQVNENHVSLMSGPLALHPDQATSNIEHKVVAAML